MSYDTKCSTKNHYHIYKMWKFEAPPCSISMPPIYQRTIKFKQGKKQTIFYLNSCHNFSLNYENSSVPLSHEKMIFTFIFVMCLSLSLDSRNALKSICVFL